MSKCGWSQCDNMVFRITREDFPLVNINACGNHATYLCSLCGDTFLNYAYLDPNGVRSANTSNINWHFMNKHTFNKYSSNLLYSSWKGPAIGNDVYTKYCYIKNIIKNNPYFIYLVPEFSFLDVLDQFDENDIPHDRLLAVIRYKQFSCLLCEGRFESFPSSEAFAAHKCKK